MISNTPKEVSESNHHHPLSPAEYSAMLDEYRRADWRRSLWQLTTSIVGLFVGWWLCYLSLSISYWLTLALAIPTALFMVRVFILQHDCGHRSFFNSKRANDLLGGMLGVFTFTPYHCWRKQHAIHHATSGDLDRRGRGGEIHVMTVREYEQATPRKRFLYRLYRNPFILFVLAPFYQFVIHQRFTFILPKLWQKERWSVFWTNIGLVLLYTGLCLAIGWKAVLMIELPVMLIAGTVGIWLFYVQHQYEETFWEHRENWNYFEAAVNGSSYFQLPKVLQWFTANIGLHHIHHLDSRIPNYYLQRCYDQHAELQQVKRLTLWESLSCVSFKLWDETEGKMVGYNAAAPAR